MPIRILVSTQMMIHNQLRFRDWIEGLGFEVDFIMNEQFLSEDDCLKIKPIYEGWIAGDDQITEKVVDHLKGRLKVISKWGTGIDSINKEYAEKNGISIKNSPGAFADAVGEMAVSYLLALTRGIVETDRKIRNGEWPKVQYKTLSGMRVGLIGLGAIGMSTANRLNSLGCEILYSDPLVDSENYEKVSIRRLFEKSSAIVITSNLNHSTYRLVDRCLFELTKNGLYIVNVGRGPIINENSLIEALISGKVIGAALDVFEQEPLSMNSELRLFQNVILGSHNANNTICAVEYVHNNSIQMMTEELQNLQGESNE
jgi:D-3-phosphoglycerate dehydrogenase / 2-oxoglutarate reductase